MNSLYIEKDIADAVWKHCRLYRNKEANSLRISKETVIGWFYVTLREKTLSNTNKMETLW